MVIGRHPLRHVKKLLVDLLQGVHALLEFDIVGGQFGLGKSVLWLGCLVPFHPTLPSEFPNCSLRYCWLRWKEGVTVELNAVLSIVRKLPGLHWVG